jgi:hypothetical protein
VRRLAFVLLLMCGVLIGGAPPPPAQAASSTGLVGWIVNHKKKTITATVKIQIYLSDCASGGGYCGISDTTIAGYIEQNIKEAWNGHHYKCYQLIFDVSVTVVSDRFEVSGNGVGVLVDRSDLQGVRSDTRSTVASTARSALPGAWESNDPADRLEVTNSIVSPSTWSYPPRQNYTYAHEFGHVIGLDDYYDSSNNLYAGAPDDLMNKSGSKTISQETIDRAVERNGDRMVDTDGKAADPNKLQCDLTFKATLKANEVHYDASNLQDSLAKAPCSAANFTASTDQNLKVDSQPVDVQVVEDTAYAPLGYLLLPTFDVLTLQNGMTGGGRAASAVGLFDLPITVAVTRFNNHPATGDIPPVFDIMSGACTGGDSGGHPPTPDCGARTYQSWLAMDQRGSDQVWPVGSSLPYALQDLGYLSPRLGALYKNCTGPTPFPGLFVEGTGATVNPGKLPTLDQVKKVSKDWYSDDIPNRIDIDGEADLDTVQAGDLQNTKFLWTLTLCPLNQNGDPPPNCP